MLDDVAVALGRRFIARKDVKAIQQPDGSYRPDHSPFRVGDLRAHVRGEATFGHYLLDAGNRTKLFAYDIDLDTGGPRELWMDPLVDLVSQEKYDLRRQMQCLAWGLAYRVNRVLEVDVGVTYSGCKGVHVYAFTGLGPASMAREMALGVLDELPTCGTVRGDIFWKNEHYPELTIEVFPKQDTLDEGGLGNLMRLPLGVNRKSGSEGYFIRPGDVWGPDDPLLAMGQGSTRARHQAWVPVP